MLHGDSIKSFCEDMHQRFIVTPTHQANGNVALVYKRFYALTLMKE